MTSARGPEPLRWHDGYRISAVPANGGGIPAITIQRTACRSPRNSWCVNTRRPVVSDYPAAPAQALDRCCFDFENDINRKHFSALMALGKLLRMLLRIIAPTPAPPMIRGAAKLLETIRPLMASRHFSMSGLPSSRKPTAPGGEFRA